MQLYKLEQIQPEQRKIVGEKAFYLSRLMQHGYPVIPGFVVLADICCEFLSTLNSTPLIADLPNSSLHIDVENYRQLRQVAQTLQQEILTATVSPKLMQLLSNPEWLWQTPALIFRPSLGLNIATSDLNTNGLLSAQIICNCDDGDTESNLALALTVLSRSYRDPATDSISPATKI